ncbi:hypothetical protein CYY_001112 [Polysphondylium violaceum]|uniref:PH domain-containing protein n=1 Tax=Polysphondylium violaceum TaxID=133409 RepID=A0A8J4Q0L3_9MYCE|nr:hypothetical protein CYY_001112 [Polysphondylium violaceum]
MVKVERKKELLKWFSFGRIKSDISYSSLMKKAGGNGKGYLDRFFVLHRNYILYFKPGKTDSRPEDEQEPQGYINLGECTLEDTKSIFKTMPLTFQISHKCGRNYLIKAKDEKIIEQFLLLIRQRIKSLIGLSISALGNTEEKMKIISDLLPRSMKLPDRVKPEGATTWICKMSAYYEAYREWSPFLNKIEQFSEICYGTTKEYVDWFGGPEGPRLSMIRCEEIVLDNWIEYIKKTFAEISTYEETRFFAEDYQDIIKHIKNMIILIDGYNMYMRQCHPTVKYVDKYLEEKQVFKQHIDQFQLVPSKSNIHFRGNGTDQPLFIEGFIKASGKIKITNNDDSHRRGSDSFSDQYTDDDEKQHHHSNTAAVVEEKELVEEWKFSTSRLTRIDNGRDEDSSLYDWEFINGHFENERLGSVLWNYKTWLWSHPSKTDYKIRFDWDPISHSFVYNQPKITTGGPISISIQPSLNKLSITKKPHPATVYADWRLSKNFILHSVVIGNKTEPLFSNLEVSGAVPLPAILIIAMIPHIKESLEDLGIQI